MEPRRSHDSPVDSPHQCPVCRRTFVEAREFVDFLDEGLFLIGMHCINCDEEWVAELEDAELEALELAEAVSRERLLADLAELSAAGTLDLTSLQQAA